MRKKPSKVKQSKKRHPSDEILVAAVLKLAARRDFALLTLKDLAKAAKVPLPKLEKRFADLGDVLALIVSHINATSHKATLALGKSAPPHDLAFEALMARFDFMQTNRAGFLSIQKACLQNPVWIKIVLKNEFPSFDALSSYFRRELATFSTLVLLGIYHYTLYDWYADETKALSHTMASLDKRLKFCQKIFSSASETTFDNCPF